MSRNIQHNTCSGCGRTSEMIEILNLVFGKNLALFKIGKYNGVLCSKCVKELQQITFDQVFFGDKDLDVNTVRDRCIDILFSRNHASMHQDFELCEIHTFFKTNIKELKKQKRLSESDILEFLQSMTTEWNVKHRHKCAIKIDKLQISRPKVDKLIVHVYLLLNGNRSEEFIVETTLRLPDEDYTSNEMIIPFKID